MTTIDKSAAAVEKAIESYRFEHEAREVKPYGGYGSRQTTRTPVQVPAHWSTIGGDSSLDETQFSQYSINVGWDALDPDNYWEDDGVLTVPGLGKIQGVETVGGMDQGSNYFLIIRVDFEDGTSKTYRKNGWYASHDGAYLDGTFEETKQVQKTITVWE